jgi:hypothetical protein
MLLDNTDWSQVRNFIIHDDGSDFEERTVPVIYELLGGFKGKCDLVVYERPWGERLGSPPAVMNWYIDNFGDSERFAKIDSDIVAPPEWLDALTGVMDRNPKVDLLGFEAGRIGPPGHNGAPWDWDRPLDGYEFEKGSHIGGVGLMKTSVFQKHPALEEGEGRFGFTGWQHEYKDVVRGWIAPDLLVSELTRIPFEPWVSLSAEYAARDWERPWPKYHPRWRYWWSWWPEDSLKGERRAD